MIFLDPNSLKVKRAKKAFQQNILDYILPRVDKVLKESQLDSKTKTKLEALILPYLDDLLFAKPHILEEYDEVISFALNDDFREVLEYIFNYKLFTTKCKKRYDAYDLAMSLDRDTCTYCNRNYTNTIIKENGVKVSRPQFDHFYDKKKSPHLALSFYNLIPCCSTCNSSVKLNKTFKATTHVHPYLENKITQFLFSYKFDDSRKNGIKITLVDIGDKQVKNTIEDFALEEIYNGNSDLLYDLLKIRSDFSDRYLSNIETSLLRDIIISRDELYRLVFGTEVKEENFHKRPFSKFKSDILKELGIINSK